MTFINVLRNAIIPCKRIGFIFNLVEPGRALMKFIANLSDACTTSSGFMLRNVIDWEKVVIKLPKMSAIDVDKIQMMSGYLNSHKEKAFDTWLRRCPEASWSHVRDALHKAGEYILEREVAEKYSLPLLAESIPMREVFSSQTNFTTDMVLLVVFSQILVLSLLFY